MNRYIVPLLLVLIATGVFIQYIDPMYTSVVTLQTKLADIEAHKKDADTAQTKIDALENVTKRFPPDYEQRMRLMVPDTIDPTRLIIDVDEMAAAQGLHLNSPQISLQSDNKKTAAFVKHVLTFNVTAPYDVFRKYLTSLEYNLALRDTAVVGFSTTAEDSNGVLAAHPETIPYSYSFSIITYSLH